MEDTVIRVLGWFVLATLALAIARQLSEQTQINLIPTNFGASYNRPGFGKGLLENFTSYGGDPASAADPYVLLADVLPAKRGADTNLTAKTCYENDFLAQTQKTGNYIQRTNNFRHAAPDSCSSPHTEFVGGFYG